MNSPGIVGFEGLSADSVGKWWDGMEGWVSSAGGLRTPSFIPKKSSSLSVSLQNTPTNSNIYSNDRFFIYKVITILF